MPQLWGELALSAAGLDRDLELEDAPRHEGRITAPEWTPRRSRHAAATVALLRRAGVGSLRRRALLRSGRRAAAQPGRPLSLDDHAPPAPHPGEMAGAGSLPSCRSTAAARRWRGLAHLLCRPCELAGADRRIEPAARPGVVAARVAVRQGRAEAGERSGHRLRRSAADRRGARVDRPLRSYRPCDDVAAWGRATPA